MAMLDELFKGNMLTAVAVGLGAVVLAPLAGPVLRPAAKAAIKGGLIAYQALAELGEMTSDIAAEAWAEVAPQPSPDDKPSAEPATRRKRQDPSL
jgi:uncharacterized protein DUF5132